MPDVVWTAPVWLGEREARSDNLLIVELASATGVRAPTGQYLELQNTGSKPVSTAGWRVLDRAGNSFDLEARSIEAGATTRFERELGGLWLNPDGDAIVLVAPDGWRVQTIVFGPLDADRPFRVEHPD